FTTAKPPRSFCWMALTVHGFSACACALGKYSITDAGGLVGSTIPAKPVVCTSNIPSTTFINTRMLNPQPCILAAQGIYLNGQFTVRILGFQLCTIPGNALANGFQ